MVIIILKIIGIILLCDFITGVIHWLEDSFFSPTTPIIGKWLIAPNLLHHDSPQFFLKHSWWQSSWDLIIIGVVLILLGALTNNLTWELCLFAAIIAGSNQIHKWSHITRKQDKPRIVNWLQKYYILQTTMHHGRHHRARHDSHYCAITNVLNPVLDGLGFWRKLEAVLAYMGRAIRFGRK